MERSAANFEGEGGGYALNFAVPLEKTCTNSGLRGSAHARHHQGLSEFSCSICRILPTNDTASYWPERPTASCVGQGATGKKKGNFDRAPAGGVGVCAMICGYRGRRRGSCICNDMPTGGV